jgi:hypothetical protein
MNLLPTLIIFAIVLYVVLDFVRSYAGAAGRWWERVWVAGKQSATILWARFTVAVAGFAEVLVFVADVLGAPGVVEHIRAVLAPEHVSIMLVAVALVSEFARRRTLNG